jgi:hypothetical protein
MRMNHSPRPFGVCTVLLPVIKILKFKFNQKVAAGRENIIGNSKKIIRTFHSVVPMLWSVVPGSGETK